MTKLAKVRLYEAIAIQLYLGLPYECHEWWVPMWLVKWTNKKVAEIAANVHKAIIEELEAE